MWLKTPGTKLPGVDAGYGSGYGSGYGYGYGYGDGDGDGYGSGYGSGYGDGDGDGYGDGDGDGYGYGYGKHPEYWAAVARAAAGNRAEALEAEGALFAVWRSGADGRPCNGGSGQVVAQGRVDELPGPLEPCTASALHGTLNPGEWQGKRLWAVALYPPLEVLEDGNKIAALKREILAEIVPNPFVG